MVEADAREFGNRDGEDGEINPGDAEAKGEEADACAGKRGDRGRDRQAEPGADAEIDIERGRCIGAEPDIERVAERQLPGKAHHDVPGLPGIGEIKMRMSTVSR